MGICLKNKHLNLLYVIFYNAPMHYETDNP